MAYEYVAGEGSPEAAAALVVLSKLVENWEFSINLGVLAGLKLPGNQSFHRSSSYTERFLIPCQYQQRNTRFPPSLSLS